MNDTLPIHQPSRPWRPTRQQWLAGSRLPIETARETIHAIADGAPIREVAGRLGVPYATLYGRLCRLEKLGHVCRTFAPHGRPHGAGPLYTWTPTSPDA